MSEKQTTPGPWANQTWIDSAARERIIALLNEQASNAYVEGLRLSNCDECRGEVAKMKAGQFGPAELAAHKKAERAFGKHFGIHETIAFLNQQRGER